MEDNDETALGLQDVYSKQNQDQDELSAEDLAWVNSCLIEEPEISKTNIDSLKEALLSILDHHSEIFSPYENELELDNSNDIIDPENSPSPTEEVTDANGDSGDDESCDVLSPLNHPFLPNFNDEMMKIEYSDSDSGSDSDLGFRVSELVMEPESEDIFKVWELDIPVEEDELVKELKEALSENDATSRVPRMKSLKIESLDSLVESIADLSLK
ncbi:uncharacterized protein LOC111904335 [Lactuca sativa]|uniref:uncharacterized protein LOC111904335 n=1 Tax=Lactuca sativa TaxID=4236 RepID=UPI000CC0BAD9|nr:uncharacterized protein LOC111904335 [Lactuca sativa]